MDEQKAADLPGGARVSRKNPLALMVLCVLWQTPTHPYGIVLYLKGTYKDEAARLNYGSLYTVIGNLEKAGLIEAVEVTQSGNLPPRTIYRVTDPGIVEMDAWLGDLIAEPVDEKPQFMTALSILPTVSVERAVTLLRRRAARLEQIVAAMAQQRQTVAKVVPDIFSVEAYYKMAMMQAELDFTLDLIAKIESGELSGIGSWRGIHANLVDGRPNWRQISAAFEKDGYKLPDFESQGTQGKEK